MAKRGPAILTFAMAHGAELAQTVAQITEIVQQHQAMFDALGALFRPAPAARIKAVPGGVKAPRAKTMKRLKG